jgi:putative flippase GtrA
VVDWAKHASGRFARFVASGAFNTAVTYALYLVLLRRLPYQVSFSIAYASGIALAYFMNRYLVFQQPGGRAGPLLVTLIYAGQYLVNLALVSAWVDWLAGPAALAPLFAVAFTIPLTYFLNRLVFSEQREEELARLRSLMWTSWEKRRLLVAGLLVSLPLLSLALNAAGWLRFGLDLPFYDDWRGYESWDIDSLDPLYLFRPLNDTLTPVGLALDALAQRYLDGNSVLYQLLSMLTVLGLLLFLQWKLLRAALGDPFRAALCFVFALLMLQPGSYWGRENLAFQQALPLVFILLALWLGLTRPGRERWHLPVIVALGLLSGLTYISGAFGTLAAGAGLVIMTLIMRDHPERTTWLRSGFALALTGVLTAVVQVKYAILPSNGATHLEGKSMALPTELDFWMFLLGKLGRSLDLPWDMPVFSLTLVAIACIVWIGFVVAVIRRARSTEAITVENARLFAMFAALSALVFTYMLMVAAGRAHFRPDEVREPTEVFGYGFRRFHFFWATLLWPWLIAVAIFLASRWRSSRRGAWARWTGFAFTALCLWGLFYEGALDHIDAHRREAAARHSTIKCLAEKLQQDGRIFCDEFNLPDLTPALIYGRHTGASFVRYFPMPPLELGLDSPSPWFRLSRDKERSKLVNIAAQSDTFQPTANDPQIIIDMDNAKGMANCTMLEVRGMVATREPDTVTAFFRPLGQRGFDQIHSDATRVAGGGVPRVFGIRLESIDGFDNMVRVDPVASRQPFELTQLEVRCRLRLRDELIYPFYTIRRAKIPAVLHRLEPIPGTQGGFKAGVKPMVAFSTGRKYEMASCRSLEVEAIYEAAQADVAQLFFRRRGVKDFSEKDSVSLPIAAEPELQSVVFVVNSQNGFEDQLRLDPVKQPQNLRFSDIKLRCLRHMLTPRER